MAQGRPADGQHRRMRTLLSTLAASGSAGATRRKLMLLMGRDPGNPSHVRMFFRDLANLQAAGWQIDSAKVGDDDRYVLTVVDPRLRAAFTPAERAQLLRAAQAAGLGQLYQDLDPALADGEVAAGIAELDLAGRAIASRCLAHFSYNGRDRVVHPFDLTRKPGGWVLRGREDGSDIVKSFYLERAAGFDIDRPGTADPVPESLPPLNLDPMRRAEHDAVHVAVDCAPDAVADVVAALGSNGHRRVAGAPEGAVRISVVVTNMDAFLDRLFKLGARGRLVGPQRARDAARHRLAAVIGAAR